MTPCLLIIYHLTSEKIALIWYGYKQKTRPWQYRLMMRSLMLSMEMMMVQFSTDHLLDLILLMGHYSFLDALHLSLSETLI